LKIVAECSPEKKLLLAEIMKKYDKITCFSGDSIGDCIAMAEANVSMTMQNSGTDVAKKTCDLVVSKDF
jgi:P-type E1-E2 ATPase